LRNGREPRQTTERRVEHFMNSYHCEKCHAN
jgi:hypothetical protein